MRLEVRRRWEDGTCTEGELHIDGTFFCYTLEDIVRAAGVKVPGQTAIPPQLGQQAMIYKVTLAMSAKHGMIVPHVLDVPMFVAIEIHWGNWAKDTEGCLLVGMTRGADFIGSSKVAFQKLMDVLTPAFGRHEDITIMYRNDFFQAQTA